jgi:hypothetical protein
LEQKNLRGLKLALDWIAHKEEWQTFYETYLKEGSASLTNAELKEKYEELSPGGREVILGIAEWLKLDFAISTFMNFLANSGSDFQETKIFQNFFKFLIGENYDASVLVKNQIRMPSF